VRNVVASLGLFTSSKSSQSDCDEGNSPSLSSPQHSLGDEMYFLESVDGATLPETADSTNDMESHQEDEHSNLGEDDPISVGQPNAALGSFRRAAHYLISSTVFF